MVARLVTGFGVAVLEERRYWVHLLWVGQVAGACATTWWGLWLFQDARRTAAGFVLALAMPGIQLLRFSALLSDEPREVDSFREHFYEHRRRFFGLSITSSFIGWTFQVVGGGLSIHEFDWTHLAMSFVLMANILGFLSSNARVHSALAIVMAIHACLVLFAIPVAPPTR